MLTARLRTVSDIFSEMNSDGKSVSEMQKLNPVMEYIDKSYTELKTNIREICFSKTVLLGNLRPELTPTQMIDAFIKSAQSRFPDIVNMNCIDISASIQEMENSYSTGFNELYMLYKKKAKLSYLIVEEQFEKMMIIADGLRNSVEGQAQEQARQIKQQLQSNVRGLSYSLYSTSMLSLIAHDIDNMREIRDQQREADRRFEQYMQSSQISTRNSLLRQFNEYTETIFDPFIDKCITDQFNAFKELIVFWYLHHGKLK